MPIAFACDCGRRLRAKDELAGRKTRCPGCDKVLTIPDPDPGPAGDEDDSPYALAGGGPASTGPDLGGDDPFGDGSAAGESRFTPSRGRESVEPPRRAGRPGADGAPAPTTTASASSIREYAYGLLVFALVPLAFSLLSTEKTTFEDRLGATLEGATPEQVKKVEAAFAKGEELTKDELFEALPGGKLAGAHLPRKTVAHWVYAAIAATGFLLLVVLMFSVERSNPLHLLGIGLFTGTVGIIFLFAVQFCSQIQIGRVRGRGIFLAILLLLAFIGWSYRSALDPDSNLLLSAFGFTFGVGLCEELTKALPLLIYYKRQATGGWRNACVWGLASGIGFGVSEGIMYSADSYNGVSGPSIYLVRFVSCVALHAVWAASVGIAIARTLDAYDEVEEGLGLALYALRVLAVPMFLHGFYDTLLKKDMNVWALVVAFASFAWFVLQVERARGAMPHAGLAPRGARRFA